MSQTQCVMMSNVINKRNVAAKDSFWNWASLTGVLASVLYLTHEVAGRIVWVEYNALSQPMSDLTAMGAPSQFIAQLFATLYGIVAILFASFGLYFFLKIHPLNRIFSVGFLLQLIVSIISLFGFALFPLGGDVAQTNMHYALAGVVVLASIASVICISVGLYKSRRYPRMFRLITTFATIFIVSGFVAVIAVKQFPAYGGLVERVNLYTLQAIYSSLSIWMFLLLKKHNG